MSFPTTAGRITLNKRVAMKCLDCSGFISKEVTLCHLFSCPLWAMRFGFTIKDQRYHKRMKRAEKNYAEEFKELKKMGIDISDFYKDHPISVMPLLINRK